MKAITQERKNVHLKAVGFLEERGIEVPCIYHIYIAKFHRTNFREKLENEEKTVF